MTYVPTDLYIASCVIPWFILGVLVGWQLRKLR